MRKNYVYLLFALFFIFSACQEDQINEKVDNTSTNRDFPEPTEIPVLKTIKIGYDEVTYESYSDGTNVMNGCYIISDEFIQELEELSKKPNAKIKDLYVDDEGRPKSMMQNGRTEGLGDSFALQWRNKIVYYYIDPNIPNQSRITDAAAEWDRKTSLSFVRIYSPRSSNDNSWINFVRSTSNTCATQSTRGQGYPNPTLVKVGSGCTVVNMKHEIGHVLGLLHEHQRPDRFDYIEVHWDNIQPGKRDQFRLINHLVDIPSVSSFSVGSPRTSRQVNIDFNSIMLYSSINGFEINSSRPSLTRFNNVTYTRPSFISDKDAETVERIINSPSGAPNNFIFAPYNVKARYSGDVNNGRGRVYITWDYLGDDENVEFLVHATDYDSDFTEFKYRVTSYDKKASLLVNLSSLSKFRITIVAANYRFNAFSVASEADYSWK